VVIGPGEQAVIEVFGEPATYGGTSAVFGPGIYLKWPWPIAKTYRYDAESVQRMNVGFDEEAEKEKASKGHKELKRFLWTMKHYETEYYVMVAVPEKAGAHGEAAVPVGLIVPTGSMFWKVKNLYDFWYNKKDPERVLRDIAYRELHVYFAGVDFFDVMGPGRERASEALRQAVQKAADEERLGVEICRFCLDGVHPPIEEEMGQAFQAVVSAEQEKQAEIYRGEAYAGERKVTAQHEAGTLRVQAHKERAERRERARGEVSRQQGQWAAYQAAPRVYKMQYYLDELTQALQEGKTRKFLVAAKDVDHEVLHLNVEDQVRLSPADVALEETPSK
jgi:regulator of protease activity HflC (stomatin/prohibitin superfamily)